MTDDRAGFRRVLHEWARRQLENESDHVGPFEVVSVRIYHEDAKWYSARTFEESLTDVTIEFCHDGRGCPESRRRHFTGAGVVLLERCVSGSWSPMESTHTVTMINELLAIADELP